MRAIAPARVLRSERSRPRGARPLPAAALAYSEEHTLYQREVVHSALKRHAFVAAVGCEGAERRHIGDRVLCLGVSSPCVSANLASRTAPRGRLRMNSCVKSHSSRSSRMCPSMIAARGDTTAKVRVHPIVTAAPEFCVVPRTQQSLRREFGRASCPSSASTDARTRSNSASTGPTLSFRSDVESNAAQLAAKEDGDSDRRSRPSKRGNEGRYELLGSRHVLEQRSRGPVRPVRYRSTAAVARSFRSCTGAQRTTPWATTRSPGPGEPRPTPVDGS